MTRRPAAAPTPEAPARWAVAGVGVAVRALPAGGPRDRYRREILGELHGMPRGRQVTHVLGVLGTAWSLRTALAGQVGIDRGEVMTTPRKPIGCRLNTHHAWRTRSTEDGGRFRQCARCGKYDDRDNGLLGHALGGST